MVWPLCLNVRLFTAKFFDIIKFRNFTVIGFQAVMGDNSLTAARHERETVDSRDKSTARLYEMLGNQIICIYICGIFFMYLVFKECLFVSFIW